jgi:hypothetical protein
MFGLKYGKALRPMKVPKKLPVNSDLPQLLIVENFSLAKTKRLLHC